MNNMKTLKLIRIKIILPFFTLFLLSSCEVKEEVDPIKLKKLDQIFEVVGRILIDNSDDFKYSNQSLSNEQYQEAKEMNLWTVADSLNLLNKNLRKLDASVWVKEGQSTPSNARLFFFKKGFYDIFVEYFKPNIIRDETDGREYNFGDKTAPEGSIMLDFTFLDVEESINYGKKIVGKWRDEYTDEDLNCSFEFFLDKKLKLVHIKISERDINIGAEIRLSDEKFLKVEKLLSEF